MNRKIIPVHPGENIQEALDQAKSGDIILVSPGTYKPDKKGEAFIVFKKRHNGVTLKGGGVGPEDVVLDGDRKVLHVVFFDQGIDRNTTMSGFTITGGLAYPEEVLPKNYESLLYPEIDIDDDFYHDGGGIMVYNSAPFIKNNIITGNSSEDCGGGISVFSVQGGSIFSFSRWKKLFTAGKGPLIYGNLISYNKTSKTGGGVDVYSWSRAVIVNNLFIANSSKRGGAIAVLDNASSEIYGNTILENSAIRYGSGVAVYKKAREVNITNNIFAYNRKSDVIKSKGGKINVNNSCFYDNDGDYIPPSNKGNIVGDPLFVEGQKGKYYLSQTSAGQNMQSPCVDGGIISDYADLMKNLTTRTDGQIDSGQVDIGYHYTP